VSAFDRLHPALQHHIVNSLQWPSLRPLQETAISPILDGDNVLLIAPTAGGKTEAAFFPVLSEILRNDFRGLSVLYVCPIRALLNNLEQRLSHYCGLVGRTCRLWHGDVTQAAKSQVLRDPPDILLTTPESIEAILVSTRTEPARLFHWVRFVIADELHSFGSDDRGWHLVSLLRRLRLLVGFDFQRLALSATVGNPEPLLEWFAGDSKRTQRVVAPSGNGSADAHVQIDYVGSLENAAHVLTRLYRGEKRLVFSDSRSRAEKLAAMLLANGIETFVSHSSLSKEERHRAERAFGEGRDCVIVATSTLELGIDVGDLDRVIQIDAPSTVSSFLQRLGRTGRRLGSFRNCLFLATTSESLLRAAAIEVLWRDGFLEPTVPPPYPVHVTAQQSLTTTLQHRRLPRADLFHAVEHLPAAVEIFAYMLARDFLAEDGGLVAVGPETERLYARRNYMELLSVFDSPPLFTVYCGAEDLGAVHELSFRRHDGEDPVLLLGGRAWRVRSVDYDRKAAHVEPCEERGRSLWLGSSQPLSFEMCQAMRRVLVSNRANQSWSRRAVAAIESLRKPPAIADRDSTILAENGSGYLWWTFAGLHSNAALAMRFSSGSDFDNLKLRLPHPPVLSERPPDYNAQTDHATAPKFAACLPEHLIREHIGQRYIDGAGADRVLRIPMRRIQRVS